MQVQVHVCVYRSQCFGPAPLSKATTANVKSLQFQWGLICQWWKSEGMCPVPCTAFASGSCGSSLLTASTISLSLGAVNLKTELWQSNGCSQGSKRNWCLVCLQERWGKSLRQGVLSKGFERHFTACKGRSSDLSSAFGKVRWQERVLAAGFGRGECKTWTAGKGSQNQECYSKVVRGSVCHIII